MRNWALRYVRQFKGLFSLSLLFGLLGVASGAMLLFISGFLITKSSLRPENIMVVYVPIVAVRAFSIGRAVFLYLEQLQSHHFVLTILERMRTRLYNSLEPQAITLQATYQTGDLLGVLSEDIERLQDFYLRTVFPAVTGLFVYLLFSIVLGFFDLPFALLSIATLGVIIFFIPYVSYKRLASHYKAHKRLTHTLYNRLTDILFGRMDWLASSRTGEILSETKQLHHELAHETQMRDRFRRRRDLVTQFVIGLFVVMMMIWTAQMSGNGLIEPTLIAAFVLMTISLADVLEPVSEAVERLPGDLDSMERVERISPYEETDSLEAATTKEDEQPGSFQIELSDVRFRYDTSEEYVIDQFDLSIPYGTKLGILGRSGSGKSTLLQLIAGLQSPTSGSVTIGGKRANEAFLGKTIGVLNQKPHLFQTSIRNNLRMANEHATDAQLEEAIEKAQLKPLIDSLPDGIDTHMAEMGSRFSGGERQRVAFCRLLLQETPIVILDEPTIGLDYQTEARLLETMLEALSDRTVILITHHLMHASLLDELVFLRDGKRFLQGTDETLQETSPYYNQLKALDE